MVARIIISGDVNMLDTPHERLALYQQKLIVFFFEHKWNGRDFFGKSAVLLAWWPRLVERAKTAAPRTFLVIPNDVRPEGEFRDVSLGQTELFRENPTIVTVRRRRAPRRDRPQPMQKPVQTTFFPELLEARNENRSKEDK